MKTEKVTLEVLKQAATLANAVVERVKVDGPQSITPEETKIAQDYMKIAVPGLILKLIAAARRTDIELNLYQLRALVEMADASDDPEEDPIVVCIGDEGSHSGAGLYAYWRECPEEGAEFIGENEEDQQRGNKLSEEFEAAQEIKPELVLTEDAQADRDAFNENYGDGNCRCHISPPCSSCTHPGNPTNQEEDSACWTVAP